MFSKQTGVVVALAIVLLCAGGLSTHAQDATPQGNSPAAQRTQTNPFRSRIFELKYRNPETLMQALQPLGSGSGGATWTYSRELKTITVRDFPENLAMIGEAISRLDKPEAAQQGIEFHVHVLIASNNSGGTSKPYPAELNDVIKQLQTTLSYKNYSLMNSDVLRGKVGPGRISNKGVAELRLSPDTAASNSPIFYEYALSMIGVDNTSTGASKVQVESFVFSMKVPVAVSTGNIQYDNIGFTTPVSVREGEKVVVGTTSMQDKGLVIVITASVVK